ncbi:RHH-type proline utilization regulon transcriptional repressor/proline dehydrogenase/delta 1-pyrroline-5-carboxylate dehydrogenase [Nocardioides luteus]|uniref:L-glutamate gamma-semialdehyde dehydrogenase n=1 Tax=Nocardioides luteus TaxID=1844 RepID=A0ABQ5SQ84_9ACTN|nr:bifunctional proline dehydrogenase/L-glutamate gamma-semialdehyde dehydrogenase [Nocardioides luteus]MDR7313233.1 RHH-type proline utilization regulon transcriptional repressor/proline dehydrogenase/delta 1-pyrroline-5-carboxylate dehydrogenase [Nocardioides luteus]GGR43121.1 1-pyrroline-5-carboxylate dehydrogenase [Nocardioides luteus]GLJ66298.1 1-pyrroline-5-carboxylate dehydrogenase [Nocardioides luteus]
MTTNDALIAEVDHLVRSWLETASTKPADPAAQRLADVLKDPAGLGFTVGFVDRVIRPEDPRAAAAALQDLARNTPAFLPWHLRLGLKLGALVSVVAPGFVIPIVRRALREMVGHLLIDATDRKLGKAVGKLRARGVDLNINLLGEAVLGQKEADRRLAGIRKLLERDDVDYVSVKVSSPVAPHAVWAYDEAVEHVVERLLPLYTYAAKASAAGTKKFINLDMEEYRDLDMTIDVFTRLLDRPELADLEAGIVLQAYLPDAMSAMMRLQEWSAARRARGGAPIKVRLVKGANLPMEHVEASLHGWPVATWSTKQDSDTNYKRVLSWALTPERMANVRIGVAGHNLFDVAYAWLLAGERQVRDSVEFEMLLGMAEGQAEAVRETVGGLLLYVPVVHPKDFDVAIAYLVRRLEEGASTENFMSAVFDLNSSEELFAREKERFVRSLAAVDETVPSPNRTQDRREPVADAPLTGGFENTADTDPHLPGNREWGKAIIARVGSSTLGDQLVADHTVASVEGVESVLEGAVGAQSDWGRKTGAERAAILRAAAVEVERHRAEWLEVAASECGKTLDQGDPEVSEAIDFLNYYASLAEELDTVDGAHQVPVRLTLVTPPWNFPLAIPTGGVAAALAAGSAVVIKPAPQAKRCGSVLVETLWAAGVPKEVLRLVHVPENEVGGALIASPLVDRLILTGAFDTAELFRSFRSDLPLLAETSGKNALVVTPDADLDLAVKDLVYSAFGHAGQKCSAASLGILVGSVASSRRFRDQLVDAVTSLKVGYPTDPTVQVGPIIEPASGKLLRALTTLAPGEEWLVRPRQLDDTGRLWSPGVKTGVKRGSEFHLTEYFGPVLGLIEASTLDEAIEIQNEVDYGLTAGIHSLDRAEISQWLDTVEAGNAYVNRGITGAIVRRQPFGGWKKSAVGAGTKAGGPNYLVGLSDWVPAPATTLAKPSVAVQKLIDDARRLGIEELDVLERGAGSDASVWAREFGLARDVSDLTAEINVLRYSQVPVTIRYEGGPIAHLLRVLAAGLTAGAPVTVSVASTLDEATASLVRAHCARYVVEDAAAWSATLSGHDAPGRVRLLGGTREAFAEASGGRVDIALYAQPVVEAGRVEMLTFLREQAVSVTAHRFGSPTPLVKNLF